jgi:glycosyltransferase involved in cell wall biosynthesis
MRILILNHNVVWKGGGTFFRTYHFGRHLARRGHDVTLLTISQEARRGFKEKIADGGLRMVETPDMLVGMGRSGWDPWDTLNRMDYIRRGDWDIVHGFDSRPAVVLPSIFAQRARRLPMVMDWCDWWGRGGTNTERANPVVRAVMGPVETFFEEAFRGFPDGMTALGDPLYQRALQHGAAPERVIELGQGSDLDGIRPMDLVEARRQVGLPEDGVTLGYLGVLRYKNLPFLLDIVEAVRRRSGQDVKLLLIGNHKVDLTPAWERGGRDYIVETGWLTYEQVAAYLSASDVLLLPLLDTIANNKIWPSKLNDYLAAGRPIVSTQMLVLEELWRRHSPGLLAGNDDADLFADAVLTMLTQPALRRHFGVNARRAAEQDYDWATLAAKLERFYEKVLGS